MKLPFKPISRRTKFSLQEHKFSKGTIRLDNLSLQEVCLFSSRVPNGSVIHTSILMVQHDYFGFFFSVQHSTENFPKQQFGVFP